MPQNKTYEIKTVQDIFECVTTENIDRFMKDFVGIFLSLAEIKENSTEEEIQDLKIGSFMWTDDGENNLTIELIEKEKP